MTVKSKSMLIAAAALALSSFLWIANRRPAQLQGIPTSEPVIWIRQYVHGRIELEQELVRGSAEYDAVMHYLQSGSHDDGVLDFTTYVPHRLIETTNLRINFTGNRIVIESREDLDSVWRQSSRNKSSRDIEIEHTLWPER